MRQMWFTVVKKLVSFKKNGVKLTTVLVRTKFASKLSQLMLFWLIFKSNWNIGFIRLSENHSKCMIFLARQLSKFNFRRCRPKTNEISCSFERCDKGAKIHIFQKYRLKWSHYGILKNVRKTINRFSSAIYVQIVFTL